MIIGVDNGNARTKTINTVFTSGINVHDVYPPISDEVLEWNGKFYTLSLNRNPYSRNKTKDDVCYVLTLFAMAKEILASDKYSSELDVDLAVGLPPEHFGLLKDKFADYFMKYGPQIKFSYMQKPFTINLNSVSVYPQAYAAVANKATELKEYSRTYVIDIGGYTTDVLLLHHGKPDLTYCRSLENGIITMNNNIHARISATYDTSVEEDHIIDVLLDRKHSMSDEVVKSIKELAEEHAASILNQLRELGIDLKSNPAIFVGGGALLFREYLENSEMTSKTEFMPDVAANALGYTIFTTVKLNKLAKKG
jgi:plasmid segregation protein ParM